MLGPYIYKYVVVYTSESEVRNYFGSMIGATARLFIWLFAMSIVKTRLIQQFFPLFLGIQAVPGKFSESII